MFAKHSRRNKLQEKSYPLHRKTIIKKTTAYQIFLLFDRHYLFVSNMRFLKNQLYRVTCGKRDFFEIVLNRITFNHSFSEVYHGVVWKACFLREAVVVVVWPLTCRRLVALFPGWVSASLAVIFSALHSSD